MVIQLSAQGQSDTQVCVDGSGVLRMVALSATCPNGQQRMILKHAGDSDVDADKPKTKNAGDWSPADKAILDDLNRRLKELGA
jgi:hypothetical protein